MKLDPYASGIMKAVYLRDLIHAADEIDNDTGMGGTERDVRLRGIVTSLLHIAGTLADELLNDIEALEMAQRPVRKKVEAAQ